MINSLHISPLAQTYPFSGLPPHLSLALPFVCVFSYTYILFSYARLLKCHFPFLISFIISPSCVGMCPFFQLPILNLTTPVLFISIFFFLCARVCALLDTLLPTALPPYSFNTCPLDLCTDAFSHPHCPHFSK